MNKIVFLCGVPRSGSTLLANLLAQNPNVYATATSGLRDTLLAVRDVCDTNEFYRAMPSKERKMRKQMVMRGVIQGYFAHVDGRVCFDKNRGWPVSFELMNWVYGGQAEVKAIVCVRDLRDVLASFEKLYQKSYFKSSLPEHATALSRAKFVLRPDKPVGLAMNTVRDAALRGWRDQMLFVEYDALCRTPQAELDKIYQFIDEERFDHDPAHVEQVTQEDDSVHGFDGLHDIRPVVKMQPAQWPIVFDESVMATPFWDKITQGARFWEVM